MDFFNPKPDVTALIEQVATATEATADYGQPETAGTLPAITYFVPNNQPTYSHDKVIERQDIEITIDVWAKTSAVASNIVGVLVATFNANSYVLLYSRDVPEPNGETVHITNTFKLIK